MAPALIRRFRNVVPHWSFLALGLLASVLALALTSLCAPFILPDGHRTTGGLLAVWAWLTVSLWAIGQMVLPERGSLAVSPVPTRTSDQPSPERRLLFPLIASLLVLGLASTGIWLLAIDRQSRAARWLRVQVDGAEQAVMSMRVAEDGGAWRPLTWQPGTETNLALQRQGAVGGGVQLTTIEADGLPVDLATVTAAGAHADGNQLVLDGPDAVLLRWRQPSRQLRVCLAGGPAVVRLFWYDQVTDLRLSGANACASIGLPTAMQGWLLTPPAPLRTVTLDFPASTTEYRVRRVDLLPASHEAAAWAPESWRAAGCVPAGDLHAGWRVPASDTACQVHLTLPANINSGSPMARRAGIALLAVAGLVLLGALWQTSAWRVLRWLLPADDDQLLVRSPLRWDLAAVAFAVALVVSGVYAVYLPTDFSNDSISYFDLSTAFLNQPTLPSQTYFRTPGYPVFLAVVRWLAGDNLRAIVLVQHGLLALLAPLVVLALGTLGASARMALGWGLMTAVLPATRPLGNMLWTDALFGFCAGACLLIHVIAGNTRRGQVLVGALAGLATMVRPNGLALILILAGWSVISAIARHGPWRRRAVTGAAALLAGYLVTAGPWHLHLLLVRQTVDLSQGSKTFVVWLSGAAQQWIREDVAINLPHRAIWAGAFAWGRDGWLLLDGFPEVARSTGEGAVRDVYYDESIRQAQALHGWEVLRHRVGTAYFLLFLKVPPPSWLQVQPDLLWTMNLWRLSNWHPHIHVGPSPTATRLSMLTEPLYPTPSTMRNAVHGMSSAWLTLWRWLALAALVALIAIARSSRMRVLFPLALFWASQLASSAWIGWPIDRYIVVTEPLLYTLVAGGGLAWTRRNDGAATPATAGEPRPSGVSESQSKDDKMCDET